MHKQINIKYAMNDNAYKQGALDINEIFKIKYVSRYQFKIKQDM